MIDQRRTAWESAARRAEMHRGRLEQPAPAWDALIDRIRSNMDRSMTGDPDSVSSHLWEATDSLIEALVSMEAACLKGRGEDGREPIVFRLLADELRWAAMRSMRMYLGAEKPEAVQC